MVALVRLFPLGGLAARPAEEREEIIRVLARDESEAVGSMGDDTPLAVCAERLIEITGNDALTGFTAPKLVWVRDNEPDATALPPREA